VIFDRITLVERRAKEKWIPPCCEKEISGAQGKKKWRPVFRIAGQRVVGGPRICARKRDKKRRKRETCSKRKFASSSMFQPGRKLLVMICDNGSALAPRDLRVRREIRALLVKEWLSGGKKRGEGLFCSSVSLVVKLHHDNNIQTREH